ncbi:MAG: hypothetical protein QXF82_00825 [Nitrososphaeria archaeon]
MLPPQQFSSSKMSFELNSVGILRFLLVTFDGQLTLTYTAAPTPSKKGPYNIFSKIEFRDLTGETRVSASGWLLQNLVNLNKFGYANEYTPTAYGYSTAGFKWPTAFAASGSPTPIRFSIVVPIAFDEDDPRGAIVLSVPNAKCYLDVTGTSNIYGPDDDSVAVGGTVTNGSLTGTVYVTQYYFNPVADKGRIILPELDLKQVHEIIETQTTANISAGMEKLFSLPVGRVHHMILAEFFNGGPDTTNISRIRFLYDGNTPTLDENLAQYLWRTRSVYGRDLPEGLFVFDFRKRPWDTTVWGQLQAGLTVNSGASLSSNTYMKFLTKSLYTEKQLLGGVAQ